MPTPPPSKRQKTSPPAGPAAAPAEIEPLAARTPLAPRTTLDTAPPPPATPATPVTPTPSATASNSRKRRASRSPKLDTLPPGTSLPTESSAASVSIPALLSEETGKKKGRTNTPWTAAEEQRLKQMRDANNSWGEIAKAFPNRTEGSVKKHWYKDMHYAEFGENDSAALREAIREYEANKWKVIGLKVNKPAKACEQYAKEHFKNL